MSYEPTTWKSGDVVTSAKLNKMEQGIAGAGGGALIVGQTVGEVIEDPSGDYRIATLNKTWTEIIEALQAGIPCVLVADDVIYEGKKYCYMIEGAYYNPEWYEDTPYIAYIPCVNNGVALCATADGYPTYSIYVTSG